MGTLRWLVPVPILVPARASSATHTVAFPRPQAESGPSWAVSPRNQSTDGFTALTPGVWPPSEGWGSPGLGTDGRGVVTHPEPALKCHSHQVRAHSDPSRSPGGKTKMAATEGAERCCGKGMSRARRMPRNQGRGGPCLPAGRLQPRCHLLGHSRE